MTSAITYEGAVVRSDQDLGSGNDNAPSLFHGQKLFFSHSVPQRQWFLENARRCGAVTTLIDSQADVVIFDHTRKNAPPGSVSYKYVELSIRNGVLENVEDHLIASGSRAERPVGSIKTASKGSRNSYTNAEDQVLWNWIKPFMDAGGLWKGNEIYKQLERRYPRHTYQSWRDRWLKHTQFQNRQITEQVVLSEPDSSQAEPSSGPAPKRRRLDTQIPISQNQEPPVVSKTAQSGSTDSANEQPVHLNKRTSVSIGNHDISSTSHVDTTTTQSFDSSFSLSDQLLLLKATPRILLTSPADLDNSWKNVAEQYTQHTSAEWQSYFHQVIVPLYRKRKGLETEEKFKEHLRVYRVKEQYEVEHEGRHNDSDQKEVELDRVQSNDPDINNSVDTPGVEGVVFHPLTNRPPEPNESRKRKQDRSSQSDSINHQGPAPSHDHSQATTQESQSQKKSQESQAFSNASLADTTHEDDVHVVSGHSKVAPTASQAWQASLMTTPSCAIKITATSADNAMQMQITAQQNVAKDVGFQNDSDAKFVPYPSHSQTAQITNERLEHARSQAQDEWIPQRKKAESPMFFSDRSDGDTYSQSNEVARTQQSTGLIISQFNGSDDAQSPSQDFETAPQQIAHTQSSLFAYLNHSSTLQEDGRSDQSIKSSMLQQTKQSRSATALPDFVGDKSKLSTQKSQNDFELNGIKPAKVETNNKSTLIDDDFTIPPPEGGWSDEDDDGQLIGEVQQEHEQVRGDTESSVDYQLSIHKPPDEEDDIDDWLVTQKARNRNVDDLIIDEICIQALEATSLQLQLASFVVDTLVKTYKKGKHPAMKDMLQFLDSKGRLRTLKKRDLKSGQDTVSKMVGAMMLADHQGVWTKSDDQKLTSTNARNVKEVEDKHGENQVRLRFKYLEQLTETV